MLPSGQRQTYKFKRLFLQVSSNKKEISIPPKTKYGKTGKKGSKFYTKKIICTHETVLKNTKIDKICYAVLVQNCIAHTQFY